MLISVPTYVPNFIMCLFWRFIFYLSDLHLTVLYYTVIKGDFGSVLDKIRGEEEFQADLKYLVRSDKSYLDILYDGKTSTSKFRALIEDMMYQYHTDSILEYLYVKASEIKATICADNKCFTASGCSKDLCNHLYYIHE